LPFENLKKSIKKHVKAMLNDVKYGDEARKPLAYIPTYSTQASMHFTFPTDMKMESFKNTSDFPKLSREILIDLFKSIGVLFVPEITLYYLKEKTAFEIFENFCMTFGADEEGVVDVHRLNKVIRYLQKMDALREKNPFNSKAIYTALAHKDFEKADKLIEKRMI
jgi:hypothetical protein